MFQVTDGTLKALSKLFPYKIGEIKADLFTLKLNGILDSVKLSTFRACGDSFPNLFLYQHTGHKSFSQVTFTMIAGCCKEVEDELNKCGHEHHDYLLPYFYANKGLKSRYQEIISENKGHRQISAQTNFKTFLMGIVRVSVNFIGVVGLVNVPMHMMKIPGPQDCFILCLQAEGFSGKIFANLREEEVLPVQL